MSRTAVVTDERFLKHRNPPGHPETPERLRALTPLLERRPNVVRIEPRPATDAEILRVHTPDLLARLQATTGQDLTILDPDTYAGPNSFEIARLAAGGVIALAEAIDAGDVDHGIALVRPPGHHCERDTAMGFCLLNHVALAAEALLARGRARIAIVDWDVHHGNGTQDAFYARRDVLFVSLHQWPLYPGTGSAGETGSGDGVGFTLNVPLTEVCDDSAYEAIVAERVMPALRAFDPEFLLVSAGFDAHRRDPLSGMEMTGAGFAALTRSLRAVAADHCDGRIAFVLEGGYDLEGLTEGVDAVLAALE